MLPAPLVVQHTVGYLEHRVVVLVMGESIAPVFLLEKRKNIIAHLNASHYRIGSYRIVRRRRSVGHIVLIKCRDLLRIIQMRIVKTAPGDHVASRVGEVS